MFTFDGNLSEPAIWASIPPIENTGWHQMQVQIDAPYVEVSIDGVAVIAEELEGHFEFLGFLGFTAGTGSMTNHHFVDDLYVSDSICGLE